jgi:hypothetical protein
MLQQSASMGEHAGEQLNTYIDMLSCQLEGLPGDLTP